MSQVEQVQGQNSALDAFTGKVDQLNSKIAENINGYRQANSDRSELISEIMNYEIRGARGKLVKHLLGFALDANWWSVYAQQYNRNKVPFVIQEKPLRKLVYTYKKVKQLEQDGNDDDTIDAFIRGYEYSIVRDIATYTTFNSTMTDYKAKWKSQHMSFKQLSTKPLKYHKVWKYFFTTNENKSIPKLIVDIEQILEFHERSRIVYSTNYTNDSNSESVINEVKLVTTEGVDILKNDTVDKFQNKIVINDLKQVNDTAFRSPLTPNTLEKEIIKALYDEEAANDSDSDSSDSESSEDEQEPVDQEPAEPAENTQKRKAVIMDPAPITNMMETLVSEAKRQKVSTNQESTLSHHMPMEPIQTQT